MRFCRVVMIGALLICGWRAAAAAESGEIQAPARPRFLILDQSAETDFEVKLAYFFVDTGDGVISKRKAERLPPAQPEKAGVELQKWSVGVPIELRSGVRSVDFGVLLIGQNGRYLFLPHGHWDLPGDQSFSGSTDELRKHLLQRKKVLASWQVQVRAQDDSISRLRADAEVIGKLGRIADAAEEIERVSTDIDNIDKDLNNLHKLLRLANVSLRPKNYEARLASLTRQVDELALAAHATETGEMRRKSASESEVQQKLAIVEAARGEDFDLLQAELAQLRRIKQDLERKSAAGGGSPVDEYEAPPSGGRP